MNENENVALFQAVRTISLLIC